MNTKRCAHFVSVAAFLFAAVSIGIGDLTSTQNDRLPAKQIPNIPPITPQQKQKILQVKHVKHDPSANVHVYGVLHPMDKAGWLDLTQANVFFESHNATVQTNTGGVKLTFSPLAVNKPHLLLFAVSVGDSPVTIQINQTNAQSVMQPTVTQSVTVQPGPSTYVPVIITPLANYYVNVTLSNTSNTNKTFIFERVTLELVQ